MLVCVCLGKVFTFGCVNKKNIFPRILSLFCFYSHLFILHNKNSPVRDRRVFVFDSQPVTSSASDIQFNLHVFLVVHMFETLGRHRL